MILSAPSLPSGHTRGWWLIRIDDPLGAVASFGPRQGLVADPSFIGLSGAIASLGPRQGLVADPNFIGLFGAVASLGPRKRLVADPNLMILPAPSFCS
jgi:hypothetical protein